MTNNGWISLHRKVKDHWIWSDPDKFRAWVNMIMSANHEDKKVLIHGELIECKRGQSVRSLSSWAKEFRWSVGKVRHFFDLLEKDGMIEQKGLRKTTRLTICKYDDYQNIQHTKRKLNANRTQTKRKQNATNNNVNNDNNENKSMGRFTPPALTDVKKYFKEKNSTEREAEKFHDYFESNGWKVGGRAKMKNWKAAARNWIKNSYELNKTKDKKRDTPPVPERGQGFGKL